jgi:succinoglycan biosynthesis transport protein ExoP
MVPKRRYLSYLRERWWVVVICLALSIGGMLTYETLRRETYTSFAQLYLSGDVQLNTGMLFTEDSVNYYGTQIELLKSARLQGAAFDAVGIALRPGERNPYKIEVFQPMKTSILALQATGPEQAATQKLLQALIEEYLNYKKDTRRSTSEDLLSSLTSELAKRETELKAEQDKWADFQKSNNVAVLEEEGKSAGLYLADLNLQLEKLKLERELLEQGVEPNVASLGTNLLSSTTISGNALPIGVVTDGVTANNDLALKSARVELAVMLAEKAKKTNDLSELHPAMRKLNDDIARLQKTVSALEEQDLTQKNTQKQLDLQDVKKRITAIRDSLPAVETNVLSINEKLSEGQRLKNNIQREQGFYDHLLTTLQGVDLSKNVQQERLSVLQSASPAKLTERHLALRLLLAGVGGLFLSLGLVFGWYLLDDRFVSVRDIKDQFGEMVLGLVPQIRVPRSKPQQVLLEPSDSRRAYAECYRHLRSALLLSSFGENRPQTLLFTGATPAEGKTTIAVNLARVLARSGLRVVLADMDAHAGGVHRLLGTQDQPGVLDFLRGEATANDIFRKTEIPGLRVAPAGSHSEHAEGLLLRPQLNELMAELKKDNDFVILDGAPILAADDSALLVPHADVVILVVRPFYTRSRLVRQALDMLYQRQAKQVAIILNRARKDDLAGHYYARNGKPKSSTQEAGSSA